MAGEEAISPRELSVALDKLLGNVSHHFRELAGCAAVTLVNTTPVRVGSMQHFDCTAIEAPWALQILGLDDPGVEAGGESPEA